MDIDDKKDVNEDLIARLRRGQEEFRDRTRHAEREVFKALADNDLEGVSHWLARDASVNARDADGRTPLFHAVAPPWRDPTFAEVLLGRGDVHVRDRNGATPLHAAAFFGSRAHIAILLGRGAAIDARDADGWTPLHCAAGPGRLPETTFLVSQGADVSIRDHKGRTPLDHALANHQLYLPGDDRRRQLELLLGGFLAVKVVRAEPDSLTIRVVRLHESYPLAELDEMERGTLTIPARLFRMVPEPGDLVRCRKGLSPVLDEAWEAQRKDPRIVGDPVRDDTWSALRRKDIGIEPER